jgi:phosphate/sulfate permease
MGHDPHKQRPNVKFDGVLSSVMMARVFLSNGSGLQMSTLRNIVLAWVLTLPAAMMLSAFLYILFSKVL